MPPAAEGRLRVWEHVVADVSGLPGAVDVDPQVVTRWEVRLPSGTTAALVRGLLQRWHGPLASHHAHAGGRPPQRGRRGS